jgi:hypothetical protein
MADENYHGTQHEPPSGTIGFHQPVGLNFRRRPTGPHNSPAWVRGCNYLTFLYTHLSGLLENVSLQYEFSHAVSKTSVHPLYSCEVYQRLSKNYPGHCASHRHDTPVSWPAHLTYILLVLPVSISENQSLPVQLILLRNCYLEFSKMKMKLRIHTESMNTSKFLSHVELSCVCEYRGHFEHLL